MFRSMQVLASDPCCSGEDVPEKYIKKSDAYYAAMVHIDYGKDLIDLIEKIPTADVEPVRHGRWERKPDPYGFFDTIPVCSVCGCTTKYREESLCCPNCGAKMDKEVT